MPSKGEGKTLSTAPGARNGRMPSKGEGEGTGSLKLPSVEVEVEVEVEIEVVLCGESKISHDLAFWCGPARGQAATGGCSCTDVVGSSWLATLMMDLSSEAEVYERSEVVVNEPSQVEAGSLRCSVVCVLFISSQAKPPAAEHAFAVESSPTPSLMADTRRAL